MSNNELNDKDLEQVTGGYVQIDDNTWHFQKGDIFTEANYQYYVTDSVNVGKDGYVQVEERVPQADKPIQARTMMIKASELMDKYYAGNFIIYM